MLLHLNEGDPVVIAVSGRLCELCSSFITIMCTHNMQACKGALQRLGPLVKSDKVNEMFQKHLNPEESLLYPDFLNDLCKLLVRC